MSIDEVLDVARRSLSGAYDELAYALREHHDRAWRDAALSCRDIHAALDMLDRAEPGAATDRARARLMARMGSGRFPWWRLETLASLRDLQEGYRALDELQTSAPILEVAIQTRDFLSFDDLDALGVDFRTCGRALVRAYLDVVARRVASEHLGQHFGLDHVPVGVLVMHTREAVPHAFEDAASAWSWFIDVVDDIAGGLTSEEELDLAEAWGELPRPSTRRGELACLRVLLQRWDTMAAYRHMADEDLQRLMHAHDLEFDDLEEDDAIAELLIEVEQKMERLTHQPRLFGGA
jgi:hypothetical protein